MKATSPFLPVFLLATCHKSQGQELGEKLFVVGRQGVAGNVELVDLNGQGNPNCPTILSNYTAALYGSVGTYMQGLGVIVCGGSDASGPVTSCSNYNPINDEWTETYSMLTPRSSAAAVQLSPTQWWVTGGRSSHTPPNYNVYTMSTELFTIGEGFKQYTNLPRGSVMHNLVKVNSTHVMLVGGADIARQPPKAPATQAGATSHHQHLRLHIHHNIRFDFRNVLRRLPQDTRPFTSRLGSASSAKQGGREATQRLPTTERRPLLATTSRLIPSQLGQALKARRLGDCCERSSSHQPAARPAATDGRRARRFESSRHPSYSCSTATAARQAGDERLLRPKAGATGRSFFIRSFFYDQLLEGSDVRSSNPDSIFRQRGHPGHQGQRSHYRRYEKGEEGHNHPPVQANRKQIRTEGTSRGHPSSLELGLFSIASHLEGKGTTLYSGKDHHHLLHLLRGNEVKVKARHQGQDKAPGQGKVKAAFQTSFEDKLLDAKTQCQLLHRSSPGLKTHSSCAVITALRSLWR
ncbi:unnamed protein product [Sphagnum tenellum]